MVIKVTTNILDKITEMPRPKTQEQTRKGIIRPPIVFFSLILIGFVLVWFCPLSLLFHLWSTRLIVGMPLLIAAGLIATNTFVVMKKNKTAINFTNATTKIITEGSFRFTRNPLYVSLLLIMGFIAVIANSGWHLIMFVVLYLFFNFNVVVREEKYLENLFKEEYIQYKSRVRRWL